MMQWDDLLTEYDHHKIRSFCGGRIKVGYPPAVGAVDVTPPDAGRLLSEHHLIGNVVSNEGIWSFAVLAEVSDIIPLPDGQSVLLNDWIISISSFKSLINPPLDWVNGTITDSVHNRLYLYNSVCVCCFDPTGLAWKSPALFDGDMTSVKLIGGRIICHGPLSWIDSNRSFVIELDADTGAFAGGDPEAVELYAKR